MADCWLLADVGGSNTRIGLARDGWLDPASVAVIDNDEHDGIAALAAAYLAHVRPQVTAICAGVAGPVRGGTAQLTNRNWHVDADALCRATGAGRAILLNDLQVQGYALDDIDPALALPLWPGAPAGPDAARLVFGLGTGCNIAAVHRHAGRLCVPASETGHTRLPLFADMPDSLVQALHWHGTHMPVEAALCGRGLMAIAAWAGSRAQDTAELIQRAAGAPEAAALAQYLRLLGSVAGDAALAHMATGGVYFIGGLARALAPLIATAPFREAFTDKGPYRPIVEAVPIHILQDDAAGLRGCTRVLRDMG